MERTTVISTADKLANAQDDLSNQEGVVSGLSIQRANALTVMTKAKQKKEGGYCADKYRNKSDRAKCQTQVNSEYAAAASTYNSLNVRYGSESAKISSLKDKVESLEGKLQTELANSTTLASQGLSSEALEAAAVTAAEGTAQANVIIGQAEAAAITTNSNVRAATYQKSAETTDDVKAGANKLLIVGGVILILVVSVIVYKKFIAKK